MALQLKKIALEHDKKIALVAHDNKKRDLVEWAKFNCKSRPGFCCLVIGGQQNPGCA